MEKKFNMMSIIGFILSFFIAPVGLVLSIMGLIQIRKTNDKGTGLAIAGIVLGVIGTIIILLLLAVTLFYFRTIINFLFSLYGIY